MEGSALFFFSAGITGVIFSSFLAASLFLIPTLSAKRDSLCLIYFRRTIIAWALGFTFGALTRIEANQTMITQFFVLMSNLCYFTSYYLILLATTLRTRLNRRWLGYRSYLGLMIVVGILCILLIDEFKLRNTVMPLLGLSIICVSIRYMIKTRHWQHRGEKALLAAIIFVAGNIVLLYIPSLYLTQSPVQLSQNLLLFITLNSIVLTTAIFSLYLNDLLDKSKEEGSTDPLSGVLNRWVLLDKYGHLRESHFIGAIIMCDIDFFKRINDQYGHDVGDKVIRSLGLMLKHEVRQRDRVIRYGGEEFLLQLPQTSLSTATEIAQRLCEKVRSRSITCGSRQLKLTASFGVYAALSAESLEYMICQADKMLYQAKQQGRNQVVNTLPAFEDPHSSLMAFRQTESPYHPAETPYTTLVS